MQQEMFLPGKPFALVQKVPHSHRHRSLPIKDFYTRHLWFWNVFDVNSSYLESYLEYESQSQGTESATVAETRKKDRYRSLVTKDQCLQCPVKSQKPNDRIFVT